MSGATDMFALGCVLFECLTGEAAFAGPHPVVGPEADPGRWSFRHALVREAAYESMPAEDRSRAHEAVASVLERRGEAPEVLAISKLRGNTPRLPRRSCSRRGERSSVACRASRSASPIARRRSRSIPSYARAPGPTPRARRRSTAISIAPPPSAPPRWRCSPPRAKSGSWPLTAPASRPTSSTRRVYRRAPRRRPIRRSRPRALFGRRPHPSDCGQARSRRPRGLRDRRSPERVAPRSRPLTSNLTQQ